MVRGRGGDARELRQRQFPGSAFDPGPDPDPVPEVALPLVLLLFLRLSLTLFLPLILNLPLVLPLILPLTMPLTLPPHPAGPRSPPLEPGLRRTITNGTRISRMDTDFIAPLHR
jgi:hypothetical protein